MPKYEHEGVVVRFPDEAAGISVSGLLANMGTLHVKLTPDFQGELFALESPDYRIALLIEGRGVRFYRDKYVACKEIGVVKQQFRVLASWKPELFQLALMIDDDVGAEDTCVTVHTTPGLFVPIELVRWARRFNLDV
jgi:hypothetical protein